MSNNKSVENKKSKELVKYIFINPNTLEQTERLLHNAILKYLLNTEDLENKINII